MAKPFKNLTAKMSPLAKTAVDEKVKLLKRLFSIR